MMEDVRGEVDDDPGVSTFRGHAAITEKASAALQQMVDRLASMPGQEPLVPTALRIIAQTLAVSDCAYFEQRNDDLVRLRYRFLNGEVLGPKQIHGLDDDQQCAAIPPIEAGVQIAKRSSGASEKHRSRPRVHDLALPEVGGFWEGLRQRLDWRLVLDIPLMVDGEVVGALALNRERGAVYTAAEIKLAERLGQQLTLAIEVDRLTAHARHTVGPDPHGLAVQADFDGIARAERAWRQITDARLATPCLESFIPAALQITATALSAQNCAFYESRRGGPIRLRYWLSDNSILSPFDLAALDDDEPLLRILALEGCTDPDFCSRLLPGGTSRATVTDHSQAGPPSAYTDDCNRRGGQLELAVPLVIAGEGEGALVVYRTPGNPFSTPEIELAERLGQQLSLSVEAAQLSASARNAAAIGGRIHRAEEQSIALGKYYPLMRDLVDSFIKYQDCLVYIAGLLSVACEQLELPIAEYWLDISSARTRLVLTCRNGAIYDGSADDQDIRYWGVDLSEEVLENFRSRGRNRYTVLDIVEDIGFCEFIGNLDVPVAEWAVKHNVETLVAISLMNGASHRGAFSLFLPKDRVLEPAQIDLAFALAQQISLAARLGDLPESPEDATLVHQWERSLEAHEAEPHGSVEVPRSATVSTSGEDGLHSLPRTILDETIRQAHANDGLILRYDRDDDSLVYSEYLNRSSLPRAPAYSHPISASGTPAWAALVSHRAPIVIDIEDDTQLLLPGLTEWHRRRGDRSIIATAMFLGAEPYGYLGIALPERARDVPHVKVGLVQALAQQVTLAVQLTQLADVSRKGAVMVERQQVVARERAAMAREIHDRLAQGYAAILIQQQTMRRSLLRDHRDAKATSFLLEQLDVIERLSRENLAEARRTMDELRSDPVSLGDLASSLDRCVRHLSQEPGFGVSLELEENLPLLRRYVETELCRIVSEAVTNARKHARSGSAHVSVKRTDDELVIVIADTGIGFDLSGVGTSFGISGMQERAARAGGHMKISTTPGRGTEVQVTLAL